jgi:hypothetical protein
MNRRKGNLGDLGVAKQQSKNETMVMVSVTETFLILVALYFANVVIWELIYAKTKLSTAVMKHSYFSYNISALLYSLNNAINLYLYCICCKRFRDDLKEFGCFRCKKTF